MNRCIFCNSTTNPFSSVEHIFPESLGNKEKILPKGVICDVCNNGTLALLDFELTEFESIKIMRTINGIKNKSGKIPTARFNNLVLEPSGFNNIAIRANSRKNIRNQSENGFQLHFTGNRKLDSKRLKMLARSLYKIGIELIYLDHGQNFVLSGRFDEAIDIIMGRKDFNGYLLIGTNQKPDTTGMSYRFFKDEKGKEFTVFEFNYLFTKIIFDIERRTVLLENNSKIENFTVLKF